MSEEIVRSEEELELELDEVDETEAEAEDESVESEQIDWKARAIKAEQLLISKKKLEKQSRQAAPVQKADNTLTEEAIDAKILRSNGHSEEEVAQLRKIAKINGTSLIDAKQDPYFASWKKARDEEEEAKKARLGASKGSGTAKKAKSFDSSGLTPEEHKRMWMEARG